MWAECSHEVDLAGWIVGHHDLDAGEYDCAPERSMTDDTLSAHWGVDGYVEAHGFWSVADTYPANRRIFEAITSTERIVMAADGIDESVYDEETATILRWFDGIEDDRICTLAQAQSVLEVVA